MSFKWKNTSLRTKMVNVVSILVVGLIVTEASVIGLYFQKRLKENISDQQFTLVSKMSEQIDEKIAVAMEQLAITAHRIGDDLQDAGRMQKLLEGIKEHSVFFDSGLLIISNKKNLVAETPYHKERRGMDYGFRAYVTRTLETGKPFISEPYIPVVPPYQPTITFAVPILDSSGKVAAVLAGRHNLFRDNFLGKLAATKIGKTGFLYIVSANRTFIIHPDRNKILQVSKPGEYPGLEIAIKGFEGTLEDTDSTVNKGLTSFKHLKMTDWILAAYFPEDEAYEPLYHGRYIFFSILVTAVVISVIIVGNLMRVMISPILAFTRHVSGLLEKKGRDQCIAIDSQDEIGQLANAFNSVVMELDRQKAALCETAEKYRVVAEFTAEIAIWVAPDGSIRYISPNCQEITGYEDSKFYGNPQLLRAIVFSDDAPIWDTHIEGANSTAIHKPITFRIIKKDGEIRWIDHSCHPVIDQSGDCLGVRGSYRDITGRKEMEMLLEEQKEFAENL